MAPYSEDDVKQHFKKHWTKYALGVALASQPHLAIPAAIGMIGYHAMKRGDKQAQNKNHNNNNENP